MESFRSFITAAQKTKKCPDGYRFDKKLRVCVPIGQTDIILIMVMVVVNKLIHQTTTVRMVMVKMVIIKVMVMVQVIIITQATEMVVTDHEKF